MGNQQVGKAPAYRWVIFIVCFLTLIIGYANMGIWSMTLNSVCESFGISATQA